MSWRRFCVLVGGLSGEAVYRQVTAKNGKRKVLTGADAPAFFARFKKAGEQ